METSGEKAFAEFESRFGSAAGEEVMDRIANADWKTGGDRVSFSDVHTHNACNHTLSGTIEYAGEVFGFVIDSGDWNGTLIREWGDADDVAPYEAEAPITYTFVPIDPSLAAKSPAKFGVYMAWKKEAWFKDAVRGYNYDRHFAPGLKTERHYSDLAARRGLRIVDSETAERVASDGRAQLANAALAQADAPSP